MLVSGWGGTSFGRQPHAVDRTARNRSNDMTRTAEAASVTIDDADPLGVVNEIAADATVAYLIGRGLAVEIDDARFPDGSDPIPAPHVIELVEELTAAASDACNAGDAVALLLQDRESEHSRTSVRAAITDAHNALDSAQRTTRLVAHLTLGVTSQRGGTTPSPLPNARRSWCSTHSKNAWCRSSKTAWSCILTTIPNFSLSSAVRCAG